MSLLLLLWYSPNFKTPCSFEMEGGGKMSDQKIPQFQTKMFILKLLLAFSVLGIFPFPVTVFKSMNYKLSNYVLICEVVSFVQDSFKEGKHH